MFFLRYLTTGGDHFFSAVFGFFWNPPKRRHDGKYFGHWLSSQYIYSNFESLYMFQILCADSRNSYFCQEAKRASTRPVLVFYALPHQAPRVDALVLVTTE
jgi:hypothetical protein